MKLRLAVVATVFVTVGCTVDPAPEPTSSPTENNPAPTSPTSTLSAAPDPSMSAAPETFVAPEKLEGEVARITYLDNAAVAAQGATPDPKLAYQMRASCVGEGSITSVADRAPGDAGAGDLDGGSRGPARA